MPDKKLGSTRLTLEKLSIAVKKFIATDKDILENPLNETMDTLQAQPELRGKLINELNKSGNTLLHRAILEDRLDFAAQLLGWGARVDVRNDRDSTPLHLAAARGKTDAIAFLQAHGADLKALDEDKLTPMSRAVYANQRGVVSQLLGFGVKDSIALGVAKINRNMLDLFQEPADLSDNRYRKNKI